MKWYDIKGNGHDVVISSRVRFARNLDDFPFTPKLDNASSKNVVEKVVAALDCGLDTKLNVTNINSQADSNSVLVEDHIISPDFCAESHLERVLLTDDPGNIAIMVNEEDHVRIQAIYPGFDLDRAYDSACKTETALSKHCSLAFDENLGFLTACPTNLGTGLRASVMLHLPGMCAFGYIKNLSALMTKIGLTVRGIYGEGSDGKACMYQLSNQITLGISENDAIEKLKSATNQIIAKERDLRKQLLDGNQNDITDKIWRSYGTLKYARKLDTSEAARLISNVRLGAVCGIIPECKDKNMLKLLFEIMPSHIIYAFPDATSPEKRDAYRANFIRQQLL